MSDPLAGQRQAINHHEASTLTWPLFVAGEERKCPVQVGEVHELRSCSIEIKKIERSKQEGERIWRALFERTDRRADPVFLLSHSGDGYVDDPKLAAGLNEDVFHETPPTLDVVDEGDRSDAHKNAGEPLEPEAVPPHEIKGYRGSRDAHQRYLLEMGAERVAHEELPLSERLRLLEESPGPDLSRQFARIEQGVRAAEAKRRRIGRKVPSDHAA